MRLSLVLSLALLALVVCAVHKQGMQASSATLNAISPTAADLTKGSAAYVTPIFVRSPY